METLTHTDGAVVVLSNIGVPDFATMAERYGHEMAEQMVTRWTVYNEMTSGERHRHANMVNAFALRVARQNGDEDMVRSMILRKRRGSFERYVILQRRWQASVSRREGRQRHHDSGKIRDRYVAGKS